ncbi:hypothetical protein FQN55_009651 [Onygenales sp. PD_40]|nr:hypothetical protein FQN55_009651 [Onygenales sp. PD_40]
MALRTLLASPPPITSLEFSKVVSRLQREWSWLLKEVPYDTTEGRPLGLAVSGGPDSMALAFLFKSMISDGLCYPNLTVKPFVVDHRARDGSANEAQKVAGFNPDILTLDWPDGTIPSEVKDFEGQARRLRFQALGKACGAQGIQELYLGHHQGDNIETVLMRLIRGQRHSSGLKGISQVAHIPECHGIYGVSESGGLMGHKYIKVSERVDKLTQVSEPERRAAIGSHFHELQRYPKIAPFERFREDLDIPISYGGVHLFRPFLAFPKSRLLSTCLSNEVPFTMDATNFDPTLTVRNTLRHLLSTDALPIALRGPSILSVIKENAKATNNLTIASDEYLKQMQIIKLDLRTGSLLINLCTGSSIASSNDDTSSNKHLSRLREIQAFSIRRILDIVSPAPKNAVPLDKLSRAIQTIFPSAQLNKDSPIPEKQDIFTIGGVRFQPVKLKSMPDSGPHVFLNKLNERKQKDLVLNPHIPVPNLWLLTRQPFKGETPVAEFNLHIPNSSADDDAAEYPWSDWQLWDDRYWIRLQAAKAEIIYPRWKSTSADFTGSTIPLIVRPLRPTDMKAIQKELSHHEYWVRTSRGPTVQSPLRPRKVLGPIMTTRVFNDTLKKHAPGMLRYTLPVLAEAGGQQRVLGFPTLRYRLPINITRRLYEGDGSFDNSAGLDTRSHVRDPGFAYWTVKSETVYKNVDHDLMNLVQRDVKSGDDYEFSWKTTNDSEYLWKPKDPKWVYKAERRARRLSRTPDLDKIDISRPHNSSS